MTPAHAAQKLRPPAASVAQVVAQVVASNILPQLQVPQLQVPCQARHQDMSCDLPVKLSRDLSQTVCSGCQCSAATICKLHVSARTLGDSDVSGFAVCFYSDASDLASHCNLYD